MQSVGRRVGRFPWSVTTAAPRRRAVAAASNTKLNNQSCGKLAQCGGSGNDDDDAGNERHLHPPARLSVRPSVRPFVRSLAPSVRFVGRSSVSLVIITDGWETAK